MLVISEYHFKSRYPFLSAANMKQHREQFLFPSTVPFDFAQLICL